MSEALQFEVEQFLKLHKESLADEELNAEETYTVNRAFKDMQDSLALFRKVSRLNGQHPEDITIKIISQLSGELHTIQDSKLAQAEEALEAQQVYVQSRQPEPQETFLH